MTHQPIIDLAARVLASVPHDACDECKADAVLRARLVLGSAS